MTTPCCPWCGGSILRIKENGEVQVESCTECHWEEYQ
jgi:hypothetical protein